MSEVVLSLYRGALVRPITMKSILGEVAEAHDLEAETMRFSKCSKHYISHPRQEFMWRCRQVKFASGKSRYSYPQIARFLGGMNHTSVMHGVKAFEKRMSSTPVESGVDDRECRTSPMAEAA